jgi:hypothetical protein
MTLYALPCYPCPHRSVCCSWGVSLTDAEADRLKSVHGDGCVAHTGEEWRTRVVDGACYFLRENACSIHGESYYPRLCRGFPDHDGTGSPYLGEPVCPALDLILGKS